ncbi:type II secretion system F family protein [Bariatricus sp. SGI.154]|uniref:type II secretion system F family protein n=1 Tax=Bariatricus sp. SGI.154 TaxID=3420549 RepID=UPI003CFE757C
MRLRRSRNCWQQDITRKDYVWIWIKAAGITVITAWLYYRSFWAVLPLFPIGIWNFLMMEQEEARKKELEFQIQFKEAIQAVSAALNTGYSVENAFREAQTELKLIYPADARISRELLVIIRQLRMHISIEQILEEFAFRVQTEDVRNFVTVFAAAKKSGGNMIGIIQNTVSQIGDKIDVKREIDTILASKRYEFRVMSAVPYAIIGYMSLSFPEFMDSLYGNVLGIGVMTVCLVIYMGAYYLGVRLIRIEV